MQVRELKDGMLVFRQAGLLPAPLLDRLVVQLHALDMDEVRRSVAARERSRPPGNGA